MRLLALLGLLAFVYVTAAVATNMYAQNHFVPMLRAASADLERFQPRILADLKLLSTHPVYPELPREKNAERFLSGFINWEGAAPLETPEHRFLTEFKSSHEHTLQSEDTWSDFLDDDRLETLDLAWVDQLTAYDHIDFETHPMFQDALSRVAEAQGFDRVQIATTLPFPAMSELRFAALARVAQLHLEDRDTEALKLYRHIGYLLSTTDSLVGSMVAVSMLTDEKKLAERLETEWPLIDDSRVSAMKRTAWAWSGIENILARGGSLGDFAPYFKRSTNACAATFEMFGLETSLQDFMMPTAPLEYDLREQITRQAQFKMERFKDCGHAAFGVFMTPIASSPLFIGRRPNPARLPFIRRVMGMQLISIAMPNYFKSYEQNPREPASK